MTVVVLLYLTLDGLDRTVTIDDVLVGIGGSPLMVVTGASCVVVLFEIRLETEVSMAEVK